MSKRAIELIVASPNFPLIETNDEAKIFELN